MSVHNAVQHSAVARAGQRNTPTNSDDDEDSTPAHKNAESLSVSGFRPRLMSAPVSPKNASINGDLGDEEEGGERGGGVFSRDDLTSSHGSRRCRRRTRSGEMRGGGSPVVLQPASRDTPAIVVDNGSDGLAGSGETEGSLGYGTCPNSSPHRECSLSPHVEDKMRRKLRSYFMNPKQKWTVRKKFPWKLIIQFLKIILVTSELIVFGMNRTEHINFIDRNRVAFDHLYLKDWDVALETLPYPAPRGPYCIYTIPDFYEHIDVACTRYNYTKDLAIGAYDFALSNGTKPAPILELDVYRDLSTFVHNASFNFSSEVKTEYIPIHPVTITNSTTGKKEDVYDVQAYLASIDRSIKSFDGFVSAKLTFSLRNIHFSSIQKVKRPLCAQFDIQIYFDNTPNHGQVPVTLSVQFNELKCHGHVWHKDTSSQEAAGLMTLSVLCIIFCALSLILTLRSLIRGADLRRETVTFFREGLGIKLSLSERMEFVDFWYIMIVATDVLVIVGASSKMIIDYGDLRQDIYELGGLTLGIGSLFVWCGMLRYLTYFPAYNVLIVTMKKASPSIFRYMVCAMFIYTGFTVCGWVVLGPYHIKFRSLSSASECLFSLVNGDDMYVTFSALQNANSYVWVFSRVYLYTFISLFIYVVLSLFISVILDTYDTIKHHGGNGFPKNNIDTFMDGDPAATLDLGLYRSDSVHVAARPSQSLLATCCPCVPGCRRSDDEEVTRLLQ